MSTGTTEEFIAHRLKQLADLGLLFTYVVEGDKHWLKSKWGYWLSWPTAKQVDDYLAGMEHGAEHATRTPSTTASNQVLSNLLALLNRDGGHYEVTHGTKAAISNALKNLRSDATTASTEGEGLRPDQRDWVQDRLVRAENSLRIELEMEPGSIRAVHALECEIKVLRAALATPTPSASTEGATTKKPKYYMDHLVVEPTDTYKAMLTGCVLGLYHGAAGKGAETMPPEGSIYHAEAQRIIRASLAEKGGVE